MLPHVSCSPRGAGGGGAAGRAERGGAREHGGAHGAHEGAEGQPRHFAPGAAGADPARGPREVYGFHTKTFPVFFLNTSEA